MAILHDIVDQVVAATAADPDGGLHAAELYRLLEVNRVQSRNSHLARPPNRDATVFVSSPRSTPLTGNEPVNGDLLTLEYSPHDELAFLIDHEDLSDMEESILSDGGIVNMYTAQIFAFIDFRLTQYRMTYCDRSGARVVFDKQNEEMYSDRETFPDRQIEWLGT